MQYNRPLAALEVVAASSRAGTAAIPIDMTVDLLERIARGPHEEAVTGTTAYHISNLMEMLDASGEVDSSRLATLEWLFALALDDNRPPKLLHRELCSNPVSFVQLLGLAFQAVNEPRQELTEDAKNRALLAYKVLELWSTIPGSDERGTVDETALQTWIEAARKQSAAAGRAPRADAVIGRVFAHSGPSADGTWPDVPIRNVLEEVSSSDIEDGFFWGVINARGVHTKDILEGGKQEQQMADKYLGYSNQIAGRWPRTAAVLRRIAKNYEREARREDEEAELREDIGL